MRAGCPARLPARALARGQAKPWASGLYAMTSRERSAAYGTRSQRGDGLVRLKRTWFEMIGRRSADSIARQRPRP